MTLTLSGPTAAEFPITGGLTRGRINAHYEMSFSFREEAPGQFCLWADTLAVHVEYKPEIFIASNYPEGRCRYKDTLAHEMRHVQMDRDTLKEYLPLLKKTSLAGAAEMLTPEPLAKAALEGRRNAILAALKKRFGKTLDQLNSDRKIRQQTIDTRAEYLRASHACAR